MKKSVIKVVLAMVLASSLVVVGGCSKEDTSTQNSTINTQSVATAAATVAPTVAPAAEASEAADVEVDNDVYAEFKVVMDAINEIHPGSSGTSLRAEEAANKLVDFAMKYGTGSSSSVFTGYAEKWANETLEDCSKANLEVVEESFDTAEEYAEDNDASVETDVAFLNVVNGIEAFLDPDYDD